VSDPSHPDTPVRFAPSISSRADRLIGRVAERPEFTARRPSRSSVLRLAAIVGLQVLERQHGVNDAEDC
jgi:hypothetical protein